MTQYHSFRTQICNFISKLKKSQHHKLRLLRRTEKWLESKYLCCLLLQLETFFSWNNDFHENDMSLIGFAAWMAQINSPRRKGEKEGMVSWLINGVTKNMLLIGVYKRLLPLLLSLSFFLFLVVLWIKIANQFLISFLSVHVRLVFVHFVPSFCMLCCSLCRHFDWRFFGVHAWMTVCTFLCVCEFHICVYNPNWVWHGSHIYSI